MCQLASLSVGPAACDADMPPTLAVLGMGQDANGEIDTMGNISGVPIGTGGARGSQRPRSEGS